MRVAIIVATGLALGGCATDVIQGATDQITFKSDPPGAQVLTSDGYTCPATPCTVSVDRKAQFIATFTRRGYQQQNVAVTTRLATANTDGLVGNFLGGVTGTSAASRDQTLEHVPDPVFAKLEPTAPPSRGSPQRQPFPATAGQ